LLLPMRLMVPHACGAAAGRDRGHSLGVLEAA
jgi:hypothetical protein